MSGRLFGTPGILYCCNRKLIITPAVDTHHLKSVVSSGWKAVASSTPLLTATATLLRPSCAAASSGVSVYEARTWTDSPVCITAGARMKSARKVEPLWGGRDNQGGEGRGGWVRTREHGLTVDNRHVTIRSGPSCALRVLMSLKHSGAGEFQIQESRGRSIAGSLIRIKLCYMDVDVPLKRFFWTNPPARFEKQANKCPDAHRKEKARASQGGGAMHCVDE